MDFSSSESIVRDKPNKPTIFIVEGRYQNWIKPIILLESLGAPYDTVVLDSAATSSEWFRNIHPQRMVPALVDAHREDRFNLWDSSSMLDYLGHRYDSSKEWVGKTWPENAEVSNWLTFETASLG
jgi:gliotoxin/aspirochlorine biosynthesis glutathione S-transferase